MEITNCENADIKMIMLYAWSFLRKCMLKKKQQNMMNVSLVRRDVISPCQFIQDTQRRDMTRPKTC